MVTVICLNLRRGLETPTSPLIILDILFQQLFIIEKMEKYYTLSNLLYSYWLIFVINKGTHGTWKFRQTVYDVFGVIIWLLNEKLHLNGTTLKMKLSKSFEMTFKSKSKFNDDNKSINDFFKIFFSTFIELMQWSELCNNSTDFQEFLNGIKPS